MSALAATRQNFIQEITQQIPAGQIGLAVIDHPSHSHVLVTVKGQVVAFGQKLAVLNPAGVTSATTDETARVTVLDNLGLDDLVTILDSFADPGSGTITSLANLEAAHDTIPPYFQEQVAKHASFVLTARTLDLG